MAELLIWIQDAPSTGDAAMDAKRDKAGNVITVQGDGWKWTTNEINNPAWRVVKITGMAPDDPAVTLFYRSEQTQRLIDNALDPLANPLVNPLLRSKIWAVTTTALKLTPVGAITTWTKGQLIGFTFRLSALTSVVNNIL